MRMEGQTAAQQEAEWERKARRIISTGEVPHFAPDEDTLAIIRRRLHDHVAARGVDGIALVLGATPELIDLASDAGLRTVSVDRNAAMFDASALRRRNCDPLRETAIVADWLDMPMLGAESIDVVLGDAALNNVPDERMVAMLDALGRVTRPGSLLLLRQLVLPDAEMPQYRFEQARAALRAGRIDEHDFDRALRFYAFNAQALDTQRHELDARRVFAIVGEKHAAGELTGEEYDFLMGRYSEVRHTVYPVSEQRRLLERLGRCEIDRLSSTCFFRDLMAVFVVQVAEE